jgi:hypothetical protein
MALLPVACGGSVTDLRTIDRLVAVHVMGWEAEEYVTLDEPGVTQVKFRRPDGSTIKAENWRATEDIGAAWEVGERSMAGSCGDWYVGHTQGQLQDYYFCRIGLDDRTVDVRGIRSPALAICLAALKAKGVDVADV